MHALNFWRGESGIPGRELRSLFDAATPARALNFNPPVDIEETETAYLFSFDIPGMTKENVKIEIVDNQLFVSGTREERVPEKKDSEQRSFQLSERLYGSFNRAFTMPTTVDTGKTEAKYENGVLHIAVPKTESAKPRQIRIV